MATASILTRSTSPPVVATSTPDELDDEDRPCRACRRTGTLRTDWQQGDRVCTQCGVVDQGHVIDTRPEWREFHDDADLAKGRPSQARSGLTVVDESRYLGGLQPTMLSTNVYGTASSTSQQTRKRLLVAAHKMDRLMERSHARALEAVRVSRAANRKRRRVEGHPVPGAVDPDEDDADIDATMRPEYEDFVQLEEQEAQRLQIASYGDKWSLERAIRLYGSALEQQNLSTDDTIDDRGHLDDGLKRASRDLYQAYTFLSTAVQTLELTDRVQHEVVGLLVRYAKCRDGLQVRGVSSTLQKRPSTKATSPNETQRARRSLREYNQAKQTGALLAALLFYTARNLGWPRTLVQVCHAIPFPSQSLPHLDLRCEDGEFIKRKHCSKAMTEVKQVFPDICRVTATLHAVSNVSSASSSSTNSNSNNYNKRSEIPQPQRLQDHVSVINFVDHAIRKLRLPPVAEACVRILVLRYCHGTKDSALRLGAITASSVYFVTQTGDIMQRLAKQAVSGSKPSLASKHDKVTRTNSSPTGFHRTKLELDGFTAAQDPSASANVKHEDLFSAEAVQEFASEQKVYEMRRVWDAWSEQTTWMRSLGEIERAMGVSRPTLVDVFKKEIFPKRVELLQALQDSVETSDTEQKTDLSETPLASVLVPHIAAAAPLLKASKL